MRTHTKKLRAFINEERILVTNKQGKPVIFIGKIDPDNPPRPSTVNDPKVPGFEL